MGSEDDVPIFSVYVDAIFSNTTADFVRLKYAILIDDEPIKTDADPNDKFRVVIETKKSNPPTTPDKPSGNSSGQTGIFYIYTANATDPDGDRITYFFNWSDGPNTLRRW